MQTRLVAHVDMDAFFASVAQLDDPSLAGKPVVVGGHSTVRGVVCSASYPARACGVRNGMPLFQALRLCPEAVVVPVCMERYRDLGRQLRTIWQRVAPVVEPVGFEEGYLDLTGCERVLGPIGPVMERLKATILRETGLTCTIGVGTSRLVAKMASRAGKPDGLVVVPSGAEAEWLGPQRIGLVPGVGPKTALQLERLGIHTIGDLLALSDDEIRRRCGQLGARLQAIARGQEPGPRGGPREARSIGAQTTLDADQRDPERLRRVMHSLVQEVAWRLRRSGSRAATLTVLIRYGRTFETISRSRTLAVPTDDEDTLVRTACALLAEHRDSRQAVRLLGCAVSGFTTGKQLSLFEAAAAPQGGGGGPAVAAERARMWAAIDRLRKKHGYDIVQRATSLSAPARGRR